jgi:hypothetical protein
MDNYVSPAPASTDSLSYNWRHPFGMMIQDVREFMALSVDEAAQLAGLEPSVWAAVEEGDIVVDPAWLRPIADALEIRIDQIETMIHFSQFPC